jgi:hypothetical protein
VTAVDIVGFRKLKKNDCRFLIVLGVQNTFNLKIKEEKIPFIFSLFLAFGAQLSIVCPICGSKNDGSWLLTLLELSFSSEYNKFCRFDSM